MSVEPLRNYDSWARSIRNFEWLSKEVSGGMDVDLLIERRGHFLILEAKPYYHGVRVPYGQHRALYSLSKQPNTLVYLVGEHDDGLHVACVNTSPAPRYLRNEKVMLWEPKAFTPMTKAKLTSLVRKWWDGVPST